MTDETSVPDADPVDRAWLEQRVARMIDEGERPDPDESLILYGLDSIGVMGLSAELGRHGIRASFQDLMKHPTLNGWLALLGTGDPKRADG